MQIVLVNPQIPQNTGSIARTCAACKTPLIIVGETPFEINDKTVRRAGLDYWPYVDLRRYPSWEDYLQNEKVNNIWFFSKFSSNNYFSCTYDINDALVFGSETKGLGQEFLDQQSPDSILKIPMLEEGVRSLNLSNCASLALYHAMQSCEAFS